MIWSFRITRKSCVFRRERSLQRASSFALANPLVSGVAVAHVQGWRIPGPPLPTGGTAAAIVMLAPITIVGANRPHRNNRMAHLAIVAVYSPLCLVGLSNQALEMPRMSGRRYYRFLGAVVRGLPIPRGRPCCLRPGVR